MDCWQTTICAIFASACAIATSHAAIAALFVGAFSSASETIAARIRVTPQAEEHAGRTVSNILAFGHLVLLGTLFSVFGDRWTQKTILVGPGITISWLVGALSALFAFSFGRLLA